MTSMLELADEKRELMMTQAEHCISTVLAPEHQTLWRTGGYAFVMLIEQAVHRVMVETDYEQNKPCFPRGSDRFRQETALLLLERIAGPEGQLVYRGPLSIRQLVALQFSGVHLGLVLSQALAAPVLPFEPGQVSLEWEPWGSTQDWQLRVAGPVRENTARPRDQMRFDDEAYRTLWLKQSYHVVARAARSPGPAEGISDYFARLLLPPRAQ